MAIQDSKKKLYRGNSFFFYLWIRCSTPNGSSRAFSKSFQTNGLTPQEYCEAMMMELESVDDRRIQAFNYMLIQKNKMAQTYNKRIRRKSFDV